MCHYAMCSNNCTIPYPKTVIYKNIFSNPYIIPYHNPFLLWLLTVPL